MNRTAFLTAVLALPLLYAFTTAIFLWSAFMKRFIVFAFAAVAVVAFPLIAAAQAAHGGDSPVSELHVSHSLVVGTTTLTPGDYKFQCKTIDGQHVLVVTSIDERREVARVPCQPEELKMKVSTSEFRSITRPDGTVSLTAVRIKGETVAHRVVN